MGRIEKSRRVSGFTVASSTNLNRAEAERRLTALIEEAHKLQADEKLRAETKIQDLRAVQDRSALVASGTSVIFPLSLIFAAPIFRKRIQKRFGSSKLGNQADAYYHYFVAGRGLWINCIVVAVLNFFGATNSYGLNGIGRIGNLLYFLVLYTLFLYWIVASSKDLYAAMQLPKPSGYMRFDNKILFDIHNSFMRTFVVLEGIVGVLAYSVYFLEKAT